MLDIFVMAKYTYLLTYLHIIKVQATFFQNFLYFNTFIY